MKFVVSGKNFEVTEALRNQVERKLGHLDKFIKADDSEAHVTLSVERDRQIVEVTISFNSILLRAEEFNNDMYTAIDLVSDVLERQIRKNKTRLAKKLHAEAFEPQGPNVPRNEDVEEDDFNIVRSKRFAIKPMDAEEAVLQMNLLGHQFFVFSNADTRKVNVVYKRKDGNYGLIEPEF